MRFLTAGESHGPGLTVIVDDFPAGVPVSVEAINNDLHRRQLGYGRSVRQKMESDTAEIHGGIRFGRTTGAPVAMWVVNRVYKDWVDVMSPMGEETEAGRDRKFIRPRPGHADLAGFYKYDHKDLRDVLERASARETAARVAAGGLAKAFLKELGIEVFSHVVGLGPVKVTAGELPQDFRQLYERAESNDLRCAGSDETLARMKELVDATHLEGTTLGGELETVVTGLPPGLGTYVQWDRRLDGLLAQAIMSIQAVKSVSIGAGDVAGETLGKDFHDEIVGEDGTVSRPSNRAGGLEGGVTNGMPLVVKAVMKPISTMRTPLRSINLETGEAEAAHFERSDTSAVPACGVVCEAMTAIVVAGAVMDKFGRDTLEDIRKSLESYRARLNPAPSAR